MDADFSIELGPEDPVLDFPWTDPADECLYVDLKQRPELVASLVEAKEFPELGEFLQVVNSLQSMVETAKCDAWATTELSAEEDVYYASHKFSSYVDVVFSDLEVRRLALNQSLSLHERFARKLTELLQRGKETPSAVEVCVRRCYFGVDGEVREGLYCTLYVSGYGDDDAIARQNWGIALNLMGLAIVQISAQRLK
jgi:hypothetical protein